MAEDENFAERMQPSFVNDMNSTLKIVLYVCMAIVIVILVSYIYYLVSDSGFKKYTVMDNFMKFSNNSQHLAEKKKLPKLSNGMEFTYSFWGYIQNVEPTENVPKLLMMQYNGNPYDDKISPDILFVMSGTENSLYALIKSQASSDFNQISFEENYKDSRATVLSKDKYNSSSKKNLEEKNGILHSRYSIRFSDYLNNPYVNVNEGNSSGGETLSPSIPCGYHVLKIDYIPLQSWFHVALCVNHSYLILYMDGEIHKILSLEEVPCNKPNADVIKKPEGDLMTGTATGLNPTNGLISKVQVFNYALGLDQARALREAGPVKKSLLQYIGLPAYGVRWPIYRKNTDVQEDD